MKKVKMGWKQKSLKCRAITLVEGWNHLENILSKLSENNPMRMAIPAITTCREQLEDVIRGGEPFPSIKEIESIIG